MNGNHDFAQLVRSRAAQTPDREALIVLPEYEGRARPEVVTYRALDEGARRLAGWLQERGAAGERVLVVHSDRRLFAISFLACLYAGALAVPVPPPDGRGHVEARLAGIVKDAAPLLALADGAGAPDVSRLLARHGHGHIPCLATEVVPASGTWREPELRGDTVAFLQYTSGSTREPRGVIVTHDNLLANQRAISRVLRTPPGARLGGWLPFHHDMGLIGQLLHPLWLGGSSVLLSPEAFVRRPARWLEAIGQHQVTVSGAPDFAYDLCVRRVTDEQLAGLDLSGWEIAVSGGEPVRPATLRAFAERFAPAGLRPGVLTPCYGLAEATLLVSGAPAGTERRELTADAAALEAHELRAPAEDAPRRPLADCGEPADGTLLIVDPATRRPLPDGRIGEIWLRGDSVARGYWRRPAETAAAFDGTTAAGQGGHLRTGDLGTREDGRLYVTGRLKDMIVVAGRNLYPQDLETTVQRLSALFGAATAFVVPGERERVVVVQELRAGSRYDTDLAALTSAVGAALADEYDVRAGAVLLVRPGTVRRTTSGKVERAAMRRLFLQGELRPLHQRIDPEVQELLPAGSPR
ncbi:fatty acyl-AMP ligase [Streptomyces angustmyceticus]|uniref:fatty acyl-AMP ligase n=1 Tax=Streptomyces angustmyceticus TaxID=285578 RepID=UPI0021AEDF22|nr:fatty acyl-AMP ligase [Streptomyces angustmyceticus]